jgi:hypothetical protein
MLQWPCAACRSLAPPRSRRGEPRSVAATGAADAVYRRAWRMWRVGRVGRPYGALCGGVCAAWRRTRSLHCMRPSPRWSELTRAEVDSVQRHASCTASSPSRPRRTHHGSVRTRRCTHVQQQRWRWGAPQRLQPSAPCYHLLLVLARRATDAQPRGSPARLRPYGAASQRHGGGCPLHHPPQPLCHRASLYSQPLQPLQPRRGTPLEGLGFGGRSACGRGSSSVATTLLENA